MDGMSSGVGLSLFQGSGPLKLDPVAENELEEEAAADQQRREEELQKLLTNAFDDLCDDMDDGSMISSIHASEHSGEGDGGEIPTNSVVARYHAAMFPDKNILGRNGSNGYHYPEVLLNDGGDGGVESYMNPNNVPENLLSSQGAKDGEESTSVLHYQHCFRTSPNGRLSNEFPMHDSNERFRQTGFANAEQLQVLYEVRVREVERLTRELESQAQQSIQDKEELRRQVTFREAEKERAQLLYQQAQSLLVECKEKISDLEKQNLDQGAMVKNLDKAKTELTEKLEASRLTIEDLHQKITILERGNLNNTDKHLDSFLQNVQAMHNAQLKKVEDELTLAVSRLNLRETELEQQKQEAMRRQQQLEARLAEKGDTVNQMARSLEVAQRQCQELMERNSGQEEAHLRLQLAAVEKDRALLAERLQGAQRETDVLQSDLKQYEAILKAQLMEETSDLESDNTLSPAFNTHGELQRALLGLKLKRGEIAELTTQLNTCSNELKYLQKTEEQSKLRIKELEEDCQKSKDNLVAVQQNLEKQNAEISELKEKLIDEQNRATKAIEAEEMQKIALTSTKEQCVRLKEELDSVKAQIVETSSLRVRNDDNLRIYEKQFTQSLENLKKKHNGELDSLRKELEQTRKETDHVKELYIKVCQSKDELITILQKEQSRIRELEDHLEILKEEKSNIKNQNLANSSDFQAMKDLLENEKSRADDLQQKNALLLEKLEKGKDNLDAAHNAIAQCANLRIELLTKESELKDLTNRFTEELKNLQLEKDQAVEELEKSKDLFAAKVTEEIEKAKSEALEDLKKTWRKGTGEEDVNSKIKKYEEEQATLQEHLQAAVRRHAEDTAALAKHLEQAKEREARLGQALKEKDEEISKLKQLSESCFGEIPDIDPGKVQKEMGLNIAAKLKSIEAHYQLKMDEACEQVKEETMRFCVLQIRQAESKYLASIKKYKVAYEEEINKLQSSLSEKERKLVECEEKLKETLQQLDEVKFQETTEWKAKIAKMEEELKNMESKAEKTEKCLEITKTKYNAAKKVVYKYKKYTEAQQKHMEKEWERINSGFQLTLNQVQQKLTKLVYNDNK